MASALFDSIMASDGGVSRKLSLFVINLVEPLSSVSSVTNYSFKSPFKISPKIDSRYMDWGDLRK